jgi:hypothetical protein
MRGYGVAKHTPAFIYITKKPYTYLHQRYTFYNGVTAPSGPRSPHYRGFMITLRHTTLRRRRVISPTHRPVPDNTTPIIVKQLCPRRDSIP